MIAARKSRQDRTHIVLAYTATAVVVKLLVFTDANFIGTASFVALLLSIYLASDQARVARWAAGLVCCAVLGVVVPYVGIANTFYLDVATQVAIYAALALGLNIVVGFAGLLDLGFIAFFAIGAYLWAIVGSNQGNILFGSGFPLSGDWFFLMLPVGTIVAAGAGVLLGLPVLRLRGDYLAIVTLGFGEVVRVLANNLDKPLNITNGPQGIASVRQPLSELADLLGKSYAAPFKWQALIFYCLALLLVGMAIVVTNRLDGSKIGRAFVAIREDELAAQAMGVPLTRTKLLAFATGAAFAGTMGVLFAAKQTFVSPESFDLNQSIGVLAMIVFGGLGSIRGAITGAAFVTIMNLQVLKAVSSGLNTLKASGFEIFGWSLAHLPPQFEPSKYERLIFGMILIAMMLYRPGGLVPARRSSVSLDHEEANIDKAPAGVTP
jgi:branched-chain amino acid transport system permease protein